MPALGGKLTLQPVNVHGLSIDHVGYQTGGQDREPVCPERAGKTAAPGGSFRNIVWDAAIEHFTETEIDKIMRELVRRLGPDGILSGYTLTALPDGRKSNALHEYEFKDKDDLRRFFTPHFKFVKVWETIYPTRHNLYFAASQSPIEVFG